MASGGAVFAAEVDDLEVAAVPGFDGVEGGEVFFGLVCVFGGCGESPAFGESEDVGVDGESGDVEPLGEDDAGGFAADTG